MIVLVLVVVAVAAIGTMLGRISHEVESARDTEYVELEGHWVRYNVIGGGPPVLLVHGWLSSSRIWEQVARRLAQRFTVYTLDLTGFGDSDKPTDGYGVRNGSRLLYAFCAHFGLTRTAVVGHDFSGAMAAKLAADHPDIVGRLILVATPADEEQIDLPTFLWLTTLPVIGPIFYSIGRLLKPMRKFWLRPFVFDSGDLPEELIEDAGKSTPAAVSKTFSVTRHEISGGRVTRQARIIKVPLLLVAGEDDQIMDPRSVSDWGQHAEQAEIVLLDKCGHLPMVELPAEFSVRILAFLTGDSRYLEYVREVPPPADQELVDEQDEREEQPPEVEEPEPPDPERTPAAEEKSPPVDKSADFGDVSWDFSPKSSSTPRTDRASTPRPEERAAENREPRSSSRPSRRSMPLPKNKGEGDAEDIERDPSGTLRDGARRAEVDKRREREPGSGRIPKFPGDLFQWSKAPDEYIPGRRSRRRKTGRDEDREKDE